VLRRIDYYHRAVNEVHTPAVLSSQTVGHCGAEAEMPVSQAAETAVLSYTLFARADPSTELQTPGPVHALYGKVVPHILDGALDDIYHLPDSQASLQNVIRYYWITDRRTPWMIIIVKYTCLACACRHGFCPHFRPLYPCCTCAPGGVRKHRQLEMHIYAEINGCIYSHISRRY
jgi:hypothetical protein